VDEYFMELIGRHLLVTVHSPKCTPIARDGGFSHPQATAVYAVLSNCSFFYIAVSDVQTVF
jgi:hypothetical protein